MNYKKSLKILLTLLCLVVFLGCEKSKELDNDIEINKQDAIEDQIGKMISSSEQTEIDTSDWQAYRNEEYGFEVKYPEDWFISDCSSGTSQEVSVYMSNENITCNSIAGRINISFFCNSKKNHDDYSLHLKKDYRYSEILTLNGEKVDLFKTEYELRGPENETIASRPFTKAWLSYVKHVKGYVSFSYSEIYKLLGEDVSKNWEFQDDFSLIYIEIVKSYKVID